LKRVAQNTGGFQVNTAILKANMPHLLLFTKTAIEYFKENKMMWRDDSRWLDNLNTYF